MSQPSRTVMQTIRGSMAGIAVVGLYFRVCWANSALCRLLGYSLGELTGRLVAEITHPEDVTLDLQLASRVVEGSLDRYQLVKRYVMQSGDVVPAVLSVAVIRSPSGAALAFQAVVEPLAAMPSLPGLSGSAQSAEVERIRRRMLM